ncbi:protease inhibitor 1-like [Sceloporus undulatus]|uniref:protease inhibitor 1-like n=1 Tax=Sceloporus undulatus TaxID=8520 RepID=UPI001C4C5BFD|nr:protease inhibitor 1-like [Sceloporus undulatus]
MKSVGFVLLLGLLSFCAEMILIAGQPDFCKLPAKPGPCKTYLPRYFYNAASKKCEKFIYGGCRGNKNNFKTLEQCRRTCAEKPGICPKAPPHTITICLASCRSDWDCTGKEKCCSYGCMVKCMKPR